MNQTATTPHSFSLGLLHARLEVGHVCFLRRFRFRERWHVSRSGGATILTTHEANVHYNQLLGSPRLIPIPLVGGSGEKLKPFSLPVAKPHLAGVKPRLPHGTAAIKESHIWFGMSHLQVPNPNGTPSFKNKPVSRPK